jgi:hypothetical protein
MTTATDLTTATTATDLTTVTTVRDHARPFRSSALHRAHPSRLRSLPLPDTEPPVERGDPQPRTARHPAQGVLTLLPGHPDGQGDDPDDESLFGPQPTPTRALPDPARWGRQVTQLIVEVLAGHRPRAQLLRWTSEQVYRELRRRALPLPSGSDQPRRPGPAHRPRVGGVRVSEPCDGVAEVAAVVHRPHRAQAMALRLEGRDGRWVVTALHCG